MPNREDGKKTVAVIGGGPAGLTAAIGLAASGIDTALIGKRPTTADNRTTALLAGSVATLETLGVWSGCVAHSAPLKIMRLVDDTGRIFRAPEVKFDASEIDLDAFGHNIENRHLIAALERRARTLPKLRIVDEQVRVVESRQDDVVIQLTTGETIAAALVIGADGRRSLCRKAAGIELDERAYPQSALTLSFAHTRPHRNSSTEFHTPSGPFTQVPLPGDRSSLVWVLTPDSANEITGLADDTLSAVIEQRLHSILGKVKVEPGRGLFPLTIANVRCFADRRVALIGEAAHVIPPVGAQGLNLGLRDAETIAELVTTAMRDGRDPGAPELMARYDEMRRGDVGSRRLTVDLLNRSLLSDFLPVQSARGLGLYLIDRIGPLRRAVMREGVTPRVAHSR